MHLNHGHRQQTEVVMRGLCPDRARSRMACGPDKRLPGSRASLASPMPQDWGRAEGLRLSRFRFRPPRLGARGLPIMRRRIRYAGSQLKSGSKAGDQQTRSIGSHDRKEAANLFESSPFETILPQPAPVCASGPQRCDRGGHLPQPVTTQSRIQVGSQTEGTPIPGEPH